MEYGVYVETAEPLTINQHATVIKVLALSDIPFLVDSFQKANWQKLTSLFEKYYQEQQQAERVVWVAGRYIIENIANSERLDATEN